MFAPVLILVCAPISYLWKFRYNLENMKLAGVGMAGIIMLYDMYYAEVLKPGKYVINYAYL